MPARAQPATSPAATAPDRAEACRSLQGGSFQDLPGAPTFIVSARFRPATAEQPALCAIEGYVNPTVNFGLLLPAEAWNGKYLVRGCGGSCGQVAVDAICRHHVRDGYACLHSDMGHRSTLSDNNWVAGNLQGLVDFGYRATHVSSLAGKAITAAFYARAPARSYFFACSTGGRQGLVEAQRFPGDFDGIVAIAPASMKAYGDDRPESETHPDAFNADVQGRPILPNRKALLLHRAVIDRCDLNDGVKDGLIGDPRACRFDPAELQCKGSDTRACMTPAQVAVARKIYDVVGAQRGSEFSWIGNYLRSTPLPGEAPQPIVPLSRGRGDPALVDTFNSPANPDLRPFEKRGGKLILVHGWNDQSVAPLPSVDYYDTMTRTMGGAEPTQRFARLFLIPGMEHCSGGPGAWAINYMGALEDWVERGKAPDALTGYHPLPAAPLDFFSTNLTRIDPALLAFSRIHRAYPAPVDARGATVPAAQVDTTPLTQALRDALVRAEAFAVASYFPRRNVLNHTQKVLWELLDGRDVSPAAASAALAAAPRDGLSPLALEVLERMRVELAAD